MKRRITQTRSFSREIDDLIRKRKVAIKDFEEFKKKLIENPEEGDIITGTGGVRKTRLKSLTKGKSGGFRVCYFDDVNEEELYLLLIYSKNEKEDLSPNEKKALKDFTAIIKGNKQ